MEKKVEKGAGKNVFKGASGAGKGMNALDKTRYADYTDKMREASKEFKDDPFDIKPGGVK